MMKAYAVLRFYAALIQAIGWLGIVLSWVWFVGAAIIYLLALYQVRDEVSIALPYLTFLAIDLFSAVVGSFSALGFVVYGQLLSLFVEMRDDLHSVRRATGAPDAPAPMPPAYWLAGVDRRQFAIVYGALVVAAVGVLIGSLYFLWIYGDQFMARLRF